MLKVEIKIRKRIKQNKLLSKHIHKLNTELKKIKMGEQGKNEEQFKSVGSEEEIENKQQKRKTKHVKS